MPRRRSAPGYRRVQRLHPDREQPLGGRRTESLGCDRLDGEGRRDVSRVRRRSRGALAPPALPITCRCSALPARPVRVPPIRFDRGHCRSRHDGFHVSACRTRRSSIYLRLSLQRAPTPSPAIWYVSLIAPGGNEVVCSTIAAAMAGAADRPASWMTTPPSRQDSGPSSTGSSPARSLRTSRLVQPAAGPGAVDPARARRPGREYRHGQLLDLSVCGATASPPLVAAVFGTRLRRRRCRLHARWRARHIGAAACRPRRRSRTAPARTAARARRPFSMIRPPGHLGRSGALCRHVPARGAAFGAERQVDCRHLEAPCQRHCRTRPRHDRLCDARDHAPAIF